MEKKSGNTIDCTWPSVVLRLNRDKRERERKRKIFRSHYREFNSKARLRSNNKRRTKTFIFRTRRRLFARGLNWFLASRCLFHSPLSDTRSQESFVFSRIPFSSGSSEELYRRFNRWLVIVLNIISETVIQRCHRVIQSVVLYFCSSSGYLRSFAQACIAVRPRTYVHYSDNSRERTLHARFNASNYILLTLRTTKTFYLHAKSSRESLREFFSKRPDVSFRRKEIKKKEQITLFSRVENTRGITKVTKMTNL